MKLVLVVLVQLLIAAVIGIGIFKAVGGSPAILIIASLGYLYFFARHGCASH